MQRILAVLLVALSATVGAAKTTPPADGFERWFQDQTLRVDFYFVGNAAEQSVVLDRLYRQGPWAGSRTRLIDPTPLGAYAARVTDVASGELLMRYGFDPYFGEYRSTDAAADGVRRAYHDTVLMPLPRRPVQVVLQSRGRDGAVTTLASFVVDPADPQIRAEPPAGGALVVAAHPCTPAARCVDIAILGEGYRDVDTEQFRTDLTRFAGVLLAAEPFASHRDRIAVRGVLVPSTDAGCDEPTYGRFRATALGATFDSLGSERYLLTEDNRTLRDVAANVPYDALLVMVNHDRYGGGGLYRRYATFTTGSRWAEYLLLHEFGHSFAGLADEYYTSSTAYNDFYPRDREPVEPNITALLDPATLKWRDLVAPDTPLPTPWDKAPFDEMDLAYQKERAEWHERIAAAALEGRPEAVVEQLRAAEDAHAAAHAAEVEAILAASPWAGVVGAYEGAGYSSQGLYRPALDCLMFSRGVKPWCPVCRRAVEDTILALSGE